MSDDRLLSNDEMRALLVSAISRAGGVNAFARAHGIKQPTVSAMKNGRIPVGGMVARALGLERVAGWAKEIDCNGGNSRGTIRQAGTGAQSTARESSATSPRTPISHRAPLAVLASASRRSP